MKKLKKKILKINFPTFWAKNKIIKKKKKKKSCVIEAEIYLTKKNKENAN